MGAMAVNEYGKRGLITGEREGEWWESGLREWKCRCGWLDCRDWVGAGMESMVLVGDVGRDVETRERSMHTQQPFFRWLLTAYELYSSIYQVYSVVPDNNSLVRPSYQFIFHWQQFLRSSLAPVLYFVLDTSSFAVLDTTFFLRP
jgi:hypothetical protein